MLCDYGCGQKAKYQFKNGKWCCSKLYNSCPNMKHAPWNKGKKGMQIPWNKGTTGLQKAWNKGLTGIYSKESLKKMSNSSKGASAFKGKKHSFKSRKKIGESNKLTISKIKKKYLTFSKIEEMRYNPNKIYIKEIQVHCKNHNCKNSKEQGGWFTPTGNQLDGRRRAIEDENGSGGHYFYCSEKCKLECPLYNKQVSSLIKQDQINSGYIKEDLYTDSEYQTWRTTVLKRENYKCEYCEEQATDVHHSRPQKLEPGFVLDPDFGVACCEKCHYKYGHKEECSTGKLAHIICK